MSNIRNFSAPAITAQIKEAVKITRARWAAWLRLADGDWIFPLQVNLGKARQSALSDFIRDQNTATWLAGTFSSGRLRSRQTGRFASVLGCQRLYVFPNVREHSVLVVGTDGLEKWAENIFRVLAWNAPTAGELRLPKEMPEGGTPAPEVEAGLAPPVLGQVYPPGSLQVSYHPEAALKNVLELLVEIVTCEAAFLCVRSGEIFRVEAVWHVPEKMRGLGFSTSQNEILGEIAFTRRGGIWRGIDWENIFWRNTAGRNTAQGEVGRLDGNSEQVLFAQSEPAPASLKEDARSWMGIPIVIGQRVIGLVIFVAGRQEAFDTEDIERATGQVGQVAYAVENAIVFAETARYLQQLALLNEMGSAASMGVDTHEVARRVMQRLRRTFRTGRAGVFLLSADRKSLIEYGGEQGADPSAPIPAATPAVIPPVLPLEKSLAGRVVQSGRPFRAGELSGDRAGPGERGSGGEVSRGEQSKGAGAEHPAGVLAVRSELAVPLKYQGTVIGALALESEESNAFTQQDEQLLVGIASHMAGLFENMRLNEETRERAQKLQDSVRQLQAVRETALDIGAAQGNLDLGTLVERVAHRARELVEARGAELGFLDEDRALVRIQASDTPWDGERWEGAGREIPLMADASLTGDALLTGDASLTGDVAGLVARLGESVVVNDYPSCSDRESLAGGAPFKAAAGVPLKFQGQVIGTLTVLDDRPGKQFRREDVQLLELLAPLVSVWIRNARLYQELQERIEAQQVAENRLIRSARLAAVGEMAAGVAHELNNPLTTVAGFVELVLEELPKDSAHRPDLELVLREAVRARGVVRRLLDFSRPAENQRVRTDLNELVGDVLTLVHHLVRTGGVEMHIELWEDLPWIQVDPAQIKQVLLNLVHNAIQAMPRGGMLAVKTEPVERQGKEWLCISVADSGVGISGENLERIFEPFFTTRAGHGTGLGLSVSYGIISEHGGSIEVESQAGQGSCFHIFLPVDREKDADGLA
jgi:signal transduction histidine kinase